MEVILTEREKLPNIVGDWGTFKGIATADGGANGALKRTHSTASKYSYVNPALTTVDIYSLSIDAASTTGTGAGVYKSNAHVQPNAMVACYWRRIQ